MSLLQCTNQFYTTTDAFVLTFLYSVNPTTVIDNKTLCQQLWVSNTTNNILAAAH